MYKKILTSLSLLALAIFSAGCVQDSCTLDIKNNKFITHTQISAIDPRAFELEGQNLSGVIKANMNREINYYKDHKYKVTEYDEDNWQGLKATKKYKFIQFRNENLPQGISSGFNTPVEIKRGFVTNTYNVNLKYSSEKLNPQFTIAAKKPAENKPLNQNSSMPDGTTIGPDNQYSDITRVETNVETNGDIVQRTFYTSGIIGTKTYPVGAKDIKEGAKALVKEGYQNSVLYPASLNMTIKIPTRAKTNNADIITKRTTYSWSLPQDGTKDMILSWQSVNWGNLFALLLVMAVISLVVYMIRTQQVDNRGDF